MGDTSQDPRSDTGGHPPLLPLLEAWAPVGMAMLDRELRFLAATRRWVDEHALAGREWRGRRLYELTPAAAQWREVHERCLAGGTAAADEERFPQPDGGERWVRWECRPWFEAGGGVGGLVLVSEDVTERRAVALAARRAEREATLLFEHAPAGVVLSDTTGRLLAFNRRAHEQLGYTREELARLTIPELDAREAPGDFERNVATLHEGRDLELETRHRRKDGSLRDVLVRARLISPGPPARILSVWDDVTDRLAARRRLEDSEQRLVESERRYRLLAENAEDVIWTLELRSGRYTYISPSVTRLRGLTVEEALAEPLEASLTAESLARVRESLGKVGAPGEPEVVLGVYDQPCRDGSVKHVEIRTTLLRDEEGRPASILGVSRDATARVEAERALRQSEERFRALIENAHDLVTVIDQEGRYTFWSPSAVDALGWTAAEMVGRSCFDLVHPDDRELGAARLGALLAAPDATAHLVARVRHRDGDFRLLEAFGRNRMHDPAVRGIVLNSRDITEQRRLEEQFRQSQKLESVGRLAGGVAHDFNNLLTVILGCAEGLASDVEAGRPASREDVEEIRGAGERARELTRQLLAFARKQVITPRALDLVEVVLRSEKLLRRVVGEDVTVTVKVPAAGERWSILADAAQLEQVIMNLAVNARDAMPEGGRLELTVSNVVVDGVLAALHPGSALGPHVRLAVKDSGAGMPPEVMAHAFEPFFTTKGPGRGTGLGLATVHGIVAQSGGSVRLDSAPGAGTTVEILFARVAEAPRPSPAPRAPEAFGGPETVLVVEDDERVRRVAVTALRTRGYRVLEAGDGARAVEIARAAPAPIALVVSDVIMPGLHGRETADRIRGLHPGARVLFVSGHPHEVIARRGVLESGLNFLAKPFTPAGLAEKVRAVLDEPG